MLRHTRRPGVRRARRLGPKLIAMLVALFALILTSTGSANAAASGPHAAVPGSNVEPQFCSTTGSNNEVRMNVEAGWIYRQGPFPGGGGGHCYPSSGCGVQTEAGCDFTTAGSVIWYCWTYGTYESINGYASSVWYRADGTSANGYIAGLWVWAGGVDTPGGIDPVAGLRRCLP